MQKLSKEEKADIIDELEQVRDTGEVNMMDRRGVQSVANELGLFNLVCFIEDHSRTEHFNMLKSM